LEAHADLHERTYQGASGSEACAVVAGEITGNLSLWHRRGGCRGSCTTSNYIRGRARVDRREVARRTKLRYERVMVRVWTGARNETKTSRILSGGVTYAVAVLIVCHRTFVSGTAVWRQRGSSSAARAVGGDTTCSGSSAVSCFPTGSRTAGGTRRIAAGTTTPQEENRA
jgi:hypothetical protein